MQRPHSPPQSQEGGAFDAVLASVSTLSVALPVANPIAAATTSIAAMFGANLAADNVGAQSVDVAELFGVELDHVKQQFAAAQDDTTQANDADTTPDDEPAMRRFLD